ncbi:type II toxin-antitoxin system RelE family toxin [Pseudomonas petrae]|uniref:type II toxin-antitoxin system RelE family toxin n=1 Tax=Pseudomonas petrae TaxID=2912190 RepID=UPI001EF04414|nr:type II toxin-antitoxin system RelE/ParE family toxin [Pseudomonas petrae]MCF7531779.1 type II toxin-antitoxin system RelE/ParE family toxin [Pseudomonas petrae]MCF7537342.1 type II toxin-antitoxin system RelE/ParE family toxin [Pseudomonas petrae]MCF7556901.1 type II toxin-antitoxin system RelE/ParE family toxin [Pseudomonas petrae]
MAWTIKYTETAKKQLKKLDKQTARRVLDFMDERVAVRDDPCSVGKALTSPKGGLWRYRIGDLRVICDIQNGELTILVIELGNRREVYR